MLVSEIAVFLLGNLSRHVSFAPWSLMFSSRAVQQKVTKKWEIFEYANYL